MSIKILGIDPGTVVFGFACLEVHDRRRPSAQAVREVPLAHRATNLVRLGVGRADVRLVEAGAVRLGRGRTIACRLANLATELESIIDRVQPQELALEEAFCGKSVQAALRIGEARGVVLSAAGRHGLEVYQFPPATIKRRVGGHGGASKQDVAAMACRSLGLRSIEGPTDVTDAVAAALCRHEQRLTPRI